MRDPVDMAAQLLAKSEFYRFHALNKERSALLVALIREAQEDGARAEREKYDEWSAAYTPANGDGWRSLRPGGTKEEEDTYGDRWRAHVASIEKAHDDLRAQVSALTERAERAEGENDRLTGAIRMVSATVRVRNKGMRQDVEDYYFLGACEEYADEALEGKDVRSDFTMGILVVEALSDETSKP